MAGVEAVPPRSKRVPNLQQRAAIKHHLGIDVSVTTLHRAKVAGEMDFAVILGARCSSVDDYEDMIARQTEADKERLGINPKPTAAPATARSEYEARARQCQAAMGVNVK
jgi:hypothetical protein